MSEATTLSCTYVSSQQHCWLDFERLRNFLPPLFINIHYFNILQLNNEATKNVHPTNCSLTGPSSASVLLRPELCNAPHPQRSGTKYKKIKHIFIVLVPPLQHFEKQHKLGGLLDGCGLGISPGIYWLTGVPDVSWFYADGILSCKGNIYFYMM